LLPEETICGRNEDHVLLTLFGDEERQLTKKQKNTIMNSERDLVINLMLPGVYYGVVQIINRASPFVVQWECFFVLFFSFKIV